MSESFNRRVHLVAHFPGVNSQTVWSDPRSGSQIDFDSFRHFAQTAERGLFDYVFLAEGLRLREQKGQLLELDVAGRPNTLSILAALAAVTERVGLVGTLSATFNEPVELARQLASIDALSGGRSGWNVVTSPDAFHGGNFRRGGFLPYEERYERAAEIVDTAKRIWAAPGEHVDVNGKHFSVSLDANQPASPQGHPVIVQAGDSPAGRDFAASHAEVIFTRHGADDAARAFYSDVHQRLAAAGRSPESLLILPGASFVLGDSEKDAAEKAAHIASQQVSGGTAISVLEQVWGRDLSDLDPDGPLPSFDPVESTIRNGQVRHYPNPQATADEWRAKAAEEGLSAREVVISTTQKPAFLGTASQVARQIAHSVNTRASDGFVLVPHLIPTGLDEFVDTVIPELQDLGVYPDSYGGTTLRDHLGLPQPAGFPGSQAVPA
ncbi:MAG: LLM class flavin-dependent oxidoreductase [Galactobacter sp.]|uniref:LLM class flavin-dependent oxidoreductase n=1 Tax=Galactobacter sp. TaxID=2676125 RepID=UPI0025C00511|nr:LLM class flavin-dependent oxidoreductase [Galactobacter sp.]